MSDSEERGERGFCPRCGDAIERPPGVDLPGSPSARDAVLCDACYFEDFDLVDAPDRVEVQVCSDCGAVHRGNRWVDVGARDYTDVAIEEVTGVLGVHVDAQAVEWVVDPEQVDENTIRMHTMFTGVIRGTPVEEEVTVPVYISRGTCDRCGRIAGDYWEALVQVRATERTPTDDECDRATEIAEAYIAEREDKGDRNAFITSVDRTDSGVDMKLSANQFGEAIAHRIVREFGGEVSAAETLATEDSDGNELYRVTFVARLPPYTPGDIIAPADDEGPVLVTSAHGNLKGVRLTTGERYEASYEEGIDPDARRLGTREDGQRTTLVTVEDAHAVQVLDPETYEARTIPRPNYMDSDAEEVPVLRSRAGLHVLPERDAGADEDEEPGER
ncbi:60S ribosomal export protein NMD3 [Haloglomus halophilum]|uniref:60S ribosomal export protein NMD3 n=1 Tax=Haloglomus halophilum TaxID=2962672 RepID=UPI0020C9657D|nr:60S ribosomal export protein NMD3 [Haloglomus halophilum]